MDQFIDIFTQQIFLYQVLLYVPREGQHERQGYRFPKKPYLLGRFVQYFFNSIQKSQGKGYAQGAHLITVESSHSILIAITLSIV